MTIINIRRNIITYDVRSPGRAPFNRFDPSSVLSSLQELSGELSAATSCTLIVALSH